MFLTSPEPISTWWKGRVLLDGDRIVPAERQRYDPFEHYSPAGVRTPKDEATRSLPYRFLDVQSSDKKAVLAFCEQYGVLGDPSLQGWKLWARGAYEAAFNPLTRLAIKIKRPSIQEEVEGLAPIKSLACPMPLSEFQRAQRELQETLDWMRNVEEGKRAKKETEDIGKVRHRFGQKLAMVRPYVTWRSDCKRWITGWDVGSLESLLYLMVLYDSQGRGQIKVCPWCRRTFMADRPKMVYCSKKCGTNFHVDKHRHPERYRSRLGEARKEAR